jgi:hypothetical protein
MPANFCLYLIFNWWLDIRQILSFYGLAPVDVMKTFVSVRSYCIDGFSGAEKVLSINKSSKEIKH